MDGAFPPAVMAVPYTFVEVDRQTLVAFIMATFVTVGTDGLDLTIRTIGGDLDAEV